MADISLCMIVKNEEAVLGRCLDSVKGIFDEIIITDTGSSDGTRDIALSYTDKVFDFEWIDDFSAARNYSFSKASCSYCMWLDADDILTPKAAAELIKLKNELNSAVDVVMMRYDTAFDEHGDTVFFYYRERIVRNRPDYRWEGEIHEAIVPHGNIMYSDIAVTHRKEKESDSDRNIKIFEKMIKTGKPLSARHKFYYANELYYHGRYEDAVKMYNMFLECSDGWVENRIDACRMLSYCFDGIGDKENALNILFKSFAYDAPRAEICCEIGRHFIEKENYTAAVFWYETAAGLPYRPQSGGFVISDCYGYIPYMQLCVCYDRMGEYEKAYEYNEKAAALKPTSEAAARNRLYFEGLKIVSDNIT